MKRNQTWKGDIINKRKDGSLILVDATMTPVMNCRPEPAFSISVQKIKKEIVNTKDQ